MQNHPSGHETNDAKVGPIVLTRRRTPLSTVAAIVGLIVYGIFQYLGTHPATGARSNPMSAEDSQIPPAPRIEEHPAIEIEQLHAQEDSVLSTYGWT